MNKACDEAAHLLKAQRIVWCYLNVLQWWTKYAQENFVFRPEGKGCQNILVLLHETPSAITSFVVLKMIGYAIDALVNKSNKHIAAYGYRSSEYIYCVTKDHTSQSLGSYIPIFTLQEDLVFGIRFVTFRL